MRRARDMLPERVDKDLNVRSALVNELVARKVERRMAIATMKLHNNIVSFRTWGLLIDPIGATARGHTAPIFRRLLS